MAATTQEVTLELSPSSRRDVIDLSDHVSEEASDQLAPYRKALYCSYHTTAGFLEQSLCSRLNHNQESVQAFIDTAQTLFPEGGPYRHDQMHLRTELSEEQRKVEPQNADSHLTFIGLGLENCVTYDNVPGRPVYFIDLDGVNGRDNHQPRQRKATIVGYDKDTVVAELQIDVPVSSHRVDSVNLKDPRFGYYPWLNELLAQYEVGKGRIDLSLMPGEKHAGLTVNEYETLLMKHDLMEVLRNPMRFMAEKGRNMLRDPGAIRDKAKNYAKYDLVHFVNQVIDALHLNESIAERLIDKFMAVTASRRLRMKRGVSLLVNNTDEYGRGSIVEGMYQSPILVQWDKSESQTRKVNVRLVRFE